MKNKTATVDGELQALVEEALQGRDSVNAIAKRVGMHTASLRAALIKDPRYAEAKTAGKLVTKDFRAAEEWRQTDLVKDVVGRRMTVAEAANKYGVTETTIRNRVKKAYPDFPARGTSNEESNDDRQLPPHAAGNPPMQLHNFARLLPVISWHSAQGLEPGAVAIPPAEVLGWHAAAQPHTEHSFILTIEDTAMTAPMGASSSFPEGSLIYVDAGKVDEITSGRKVIARLHSSGELVFRIFRETAGKRWLEPLNLMYEPIREPFMLLGLVFGKWEEV